MNTFGHNFRVTVFGESHGECIGVVMDGVPAGIPLAEEDFFEDLGRRRSGAAGTTPRHEADKPQIVSGVYNGRTTGAPLTVLFRNENIRSSDYDELRRIPRPGHADYVAGVKFGGYNDPRGGGHFSGRLTLTLVAAGVVAKKLLGTSVSLHARLAELGGLPIEAPSQQPCGTSPDAPQPGGAITAAAPTKTTAAPDASSGTAAPFNTPASPASLPAAVAEKLEEAARDGDSLGGIVECTVEGVPAGLGEPFFDSVESLLSHIVFSIPGVRGIEFGDGFAAAAMRGLEHNDPIGKDGLPAKNGAGGVNGGLTNGAPLVFRVAFKPTSSIAKPQLTLNLETGEQAELRVKGRHDTCFALRTPVIVEAAAAIVLADLI